VGIEGNEKMDKLANEALKAEHIYKFHLVNQKLKLSLKILLTKCGRIHTVKKYSNLRRQRKICLQGWE